MAVYLSRYADFTRCNTCGYTGGPYDEICPGCTQLEEMQKQTKIMQDMHNNASRQASNQSNGGNLISGSVGVAGIVWTIFKLFFGSWKRVLATLVGIPVAYLIVVLVLVNTVWKHDPSPVQAPAQNNAAIEEKAPQQKIEAAPQEQAQSAPVATTPATPVADSTPFAPSFDCAKASNNAEKMICGDRNLSKLDVQLSQAYSAARDKATDKAQIKSEQIAWVKTSRACPDTACLTKAFQDRIKQLSN